MTYPTIAASAAQISDATMRERFLEIDWEDHTQSRFHYVWLRDNCYCDICHDPLTHQKMVRLVDIPQDIAPRGLTFTKHGINLQWHHPMHESTFDAQWLRAHCYSASRRQARKFRPATWNAESAEAFLQMDYRLVTQNESRELEMLESVRDHGFVLLNHVPVEPQETERLARRFGYPRETNWGVILDVYAQSDPVNIASTGAPIAPHTDDSFRYGMPGIDMFHCMKADQRDGGESLLVDGFRVAEVLRRENPRAFDLLSTVRAPQFALDIDTELRARAPVFTLDDEGDVTGIRYCECTQAPLDLSEDLVEPYYAALRTMAHLVQHEALVHRFRLSPGQTVVFDNQRVLHGRTGFEGNRWLRSVYVDRDAYHSRLRVLGQRHHRTDFHLQLPVGAGL